MRVDIIAGEGFPAADLWLADRLTSLGMAKACGQCSASFLWFALLILLGRAPLCAAMPPAQSPANPLKIVGVLFADFRGEPSAHFSMPAGGEVTLTFQVEGFQRQRGESQSGLWEWEEQVHLRYEVELRDPQGQMVQPKEEGEIKTRLSPRDQQWQPRIHWSALVPASAPSGDYKIHILVIDQLSGRQTTYLAPFRVLGETIQPAASLQVEQLEYASSAGGPWFPRRFFAPADTIRVRHKVVGFRVSPTKEVWVEQDWTVLNAEGNVVVTQINATVDKRQSFYPPRFLSTMFDVKLQDPAPGEYTLRIGVRDRIGQQETSYDSTFTVRP
ncbi:MAG: hypothetical protein HYS38_04225 [Acidobacteria bacterium]|nr:hypothetical protein [Acidobacteriota bacterium]